MPTQSLRSSLLAFCLVGTLAPIALLDCASSSSNSGSGNPDGGVCPAAEPASGGACAAAEGTTCTYPGAATPGCYCCNGFGGAPSYVCSRGTWQGVAYASGGNTPNNVEACPAIMPMQGSGCSTSCGGPRQSCTYDCATGNGRAGNATCVNGSWMIMELGLACPVDGGADASDASDAAAD